MTRRYTRKRKGKGGPRVNTSKYANQLKKTFKNKNPFESTKAKMNRPKIPIQTNLPPLNVETLKGNPVGFKPFNFPGPRTPDGKPLMKAPGSVDSHGYYIKPPKTPKHTREQEQITHNLNDAIKNAKYNRKMFKETKPKKRWGGKKSRKRKRKRKNKRTRRKKKRKKTRRKR